MMNIEIISCLNDNYCYVIYEKSSNLVGVIDPSEFVAVDEFISKDYKKIDYILNTHHHIDHVGGNILLKKKYNSKILGSEVDKNRIPGIDILLNSNDIFKFGNIDFKIIFVPGHTKGHIAFYSESEKVIFTGDTLFSLGCGKIFEGTSDQLYNSLNKIKKLPKDTKIFCGHEYTENNLKFCLKFDVDNLLLSNKLNWILDRKKKGLPTVPVTLDDELKTNIFLRCDNIAIKNYLKMPNCSEQLIFDKLRNLKDIF